MTRRQLLLGLGSLAMLPHRSAASSRFRLAICNETFPGFKFEQMCQAARRFGYTGVEIAPFTLSDDPAILPQEKRRELRRTLASEGIDYVGLHAILTAPAGLHVTTRDGAVRRRSWEYVRKLLDLAADLGEGSIVVFGSGKQRSATGGDSVAEATARFQEGLAGVAGIAETRGVTILIEALAPHLSNVVTSLETAVKMVTQIGSPAVQTMFDTHNAVKETLPHGELIRKYARYLRHVHVNEMDGRHPGTGSYDFKSVLQALKEVSYQKWISLEVFDFTAGPEAIAGESARLLRRWESELERSANK